MLAGVGIDLISFPLQSDPAIIAPALIARLGILSLVAAPIAFAGLYAYTYYLIYRASYDAAMKSLHENGAPAP